MAERIIDWRDLPAGGYEGARRYSTDEEEVLPCTHCGGEGFCSDAADPLGDCPDALHACHACGGTGDREKQVTF